MNSSADADFLAGRLKDHVAAIRSHVLASHAGAKFELLWPADVNQDVAVLTGFAGVGGRLKLSGWRRGVMSPDGCMTASAAEVAYSEPIRSPFRRRSITDSGPKPITYLGCRSTLKLLKRDDDAPTDLSPDRSSER